MFLLPANWWPSLVPLHHCSFLSISSNNYAFHVVCWIKVTFFPPGNTALRGTYAYSMPFCSVEPSGDTLGLSQITGTTLKGDSEPLSRLLQVSPAKGMLIAIATFSDWNTTWTVMVLFYADNIENRFSSIKCRYVSIPFHNNSSLFQQTLLTKGSSAYAVQFVP